jgi:uncharacterized protein YndB with AHSA1/START domain
MASAQSSPGLTLQVRRTFAAPREKVFAAWTQREQLEKWMCADVPAHKVIHHQQDIRPGGQWRIEIRDSAKNEVYWGQGEYREVTPVERLVFTWCWTKDTPDGVNLHPGSENTVVTVEFFARDNSTEVVLTHAPFSSAHLRDDHDRGWNGCFDVLAKVLHV